MQRRDLAMLSLGNTWWGVKVLLTSKMVQSCGQVVLYNLSSMSLLASDSFLGSLHCNLIMPFWHPQLLAILRKGAYALVHKHKRQSPLICSHIAGVHNLELVCEFSCKHLTMTFTSSNNSCLHIQGYFAVLWAGTTCISIIGPFPLTSKRSLNMI